MELHQSRIPFDKTKQFGKLFLDYVHGKISEFYVYELSEKGINDFTDKNKYEWLDRDLLVKELTTQNGGVNLTEASKKNIEGLRDKHTYTIVTGHQLCLATGPLYFIYKILSVINLTEALNTKYPDKKFVPVYWMASEDHDFEEINHVNLFNKKFVWQTDQKGKVGEFILENIHSFIDEMRSVLGENENAKTLIALLERAYSHGTLADSTRYLVNELFGKYGLVIADGNSKALKQQFSEEIKKDVFEQFAFKAVTGTIEKLKSLGYDAQVSPREINTFCAGENFRERIVFENGQYKVLNTHLQFSKEELNDKIEQETEFFSPNVVMRPLYQQKILPNAAYVGGPGELAYWLEYKQMFSEANIPFPVLIPRSFVTYVEKGLSQRMEKLNIKLEELYLDKDQLLKSFALKQQPFDLQTEKDHLKKLFEEAKQKISAVDKTLEAATEADYQKALKGIENLEQKAIRSIKQRSEQSLNQVEAIYSRFFPNGVPQERVENFMRYYLSNPDFIDDVKRKLQSFSDSIQVLQEA